MAKMWMWVAQYGDLGDTDADDAAEQIEEWCKLCESWTPETIRKVADGEWK